MSSTTPKLDSKIAASTLAEPQDRQAGGPLTKAKARLARKLRLSTDGGQGARDTKEIKAAHAAPAAKTASLLVGLFHPATRAMRTQKVEMLSTATKVSRGDRRLHSFLTEKLPAMRAELAENNMRVDDFTFASADKTQLQGMLVRGPGLPGQKPTLVMVPGNLMMAEELLLVAGRHVEDLGCNVLLYNSRGIGSSQGHETTINDAVADCEAAITFAAKMSKSLAVWGFSLGGGITAEALKNLKKTPNVHEKVQLYVNLKSFASLSRAAGSVAGALASPLGTPAKHVARKLMKQVGFNNLNSAKTLAAMDLAPKVLVYSTSDDEMIAGAAKLSHGLQSKQAAPEVSNITFVDGQGSHMSSSYVDDDNYLDVLKQWAGPRK